MGDEQGTVAQAEGRETAMTHEIDIGPHTYTITHDGDRWYNFPYKVERDGRWIDRTSTKWGAKLAIRREVRRLRRGNRLIWKGTR